MGEQLTKKLNDLKTAVRTAMNAFIEAPHDMHRAEVAWAMKQYQDFMTQAESLLGTGPSADNAPLAGIPSSVR